jgi:hypothetical protein
VTFNIKHFVKFTWTALFRTRRTNFRLTPRRIDTLMGFYALFPLLELANWFGLLLDDMFFARHRQETIRQPVFIVGNPRSGTTFLHRLLARDRRNFVTMQFWEILLAPSVVQRKMVRALAALDRRMGSRLHNLLATWEKLWQEENSMHKVAFWAPEEDQYLFVHVWSTLAIHTFSSLLEGADPYICFDTEMARTQKQRMMAFYGRCIQRHLYAHGDGRSQTAHYLSKNPSASPKIDTLYEFFPDAKFIYLVRNPLDVIPSYISLVNYTWRLFGASPDGHKSRDYVLDIVRHWYRYPLERLARAPKNSYAVVKYDDLIGDPYQTITGIYDRLDLEVCSAFAGVLQEEAEKARNYHSRHTYSLEEMGLTRHQIVADFEDVFDRFGFDKREGSDERGKRAGKQRRYDERRRTRQAKSRQRQILKPA